MDQQPDRLTTFTADEANRIFEELKGLDVDLDVDPLAYGPKRLNQKVSELKSALGRCERIFLDLSQQHHAVQRLRLVAEADLDLSKKNLFANDPETRSGRSVSDREAIATGKLRKEVLGLRDLDLTLQSLDAVLVVVKTTRSSLRDTQARLRDQIRLCQEEIGLGSSWGSKVPNAAPLKPVPVSRASLDSIEDLVGGVEGEIGHLVPEEENTSIGEVEIPPEIIDVGIVDPLEDDILEGLAQIAKVPTEPSPVAIPTPVPVVTPVRVEESEQDLLQGLLDTSEGAALDLGSGEIKELPPDASPADEVEAFMDSLAEDPYLVRGKTSTLDESLASILDSFEEVKK